MTRRLWLAALLLGSTAVQATVLWRGDFSTGDLSQWSGWQAPALDRLAVVPARNPAGQALRVTLKAGDVAWNQAHTHALNNRAELVRGETLGEGAERWYHYGVLFPPDFAVTDGKDGGAVFTQFHHVNASGEPGSPPLMLVAMTDRIDVVQVPYLNAPRGVVLGSAPQAKGRWRDVELHVVFSSDPSAGLVELWLDGKPVVSRHVATLFAGYTNYLKLGLYRRPTAVETNVVWFDRMVEGTTRQDR